MPVFVIREIAFYVLTQRTIAGKDNAMTVQSYAAEVEQIILPAVRDLGDGFQIRRALPSMHRRDGRTVHLSRQLRPRRLSGR